MPYKFIFITNGDITFEAELKSMVCAHTDHDKQCKKNVIIGLPYCWIHLIKRLSLKIKDCIYGKGLFAQNSIKFKNNNKEIVFKKNDIIGLYLGEILKDTEIDKRYDVNTAPYTTHIADGNLNIDSAIQRFYGSLINHDEKPNCRQFTMTKDEFLKKYNKKKNIKEFINQYTNYYNNCIQVVVIFAIKDIRYGEELLLNYNSKKKKNKYTFDGDFETKYVNKSKMEKNNLLKEIDNMKKPPIKINKPKLIKPKLIKPKLINKPKKNAYNVLMDALEENKRNEVKEIAPFKKKTIDHIIKSDNIKKKKPNDYMTKMIYLTSKKENEKLFEKIEKEINENEIKEKDKAQKISKNETNISDIISGLFNN